MAIPDTDTFSLQDVITEFGLASGDGLFECFEEAVAGSFDPSHNPNADGTDNNLLNFRNYGAGNTVLTLYSTFNSNSRENIFVSGTTASQTISVKYTIISINGTGAEVSGPSGFTTLTAVGQNTTHSAVVEPGFSYYAIITYATSSGFGSAVVECEITGATVDGIPDANTITITIEILSP